MTPRTRASGSSGDSGQRSPATSCRNWRPPSPRLTIRTCSCGRTLRCASTSQRPVYRYSTAYIRACTSCRTVISFACVAHVALFESLVTGLPDSVLVRFCLLMLAVHALYCICMIPAISPLSAGMVPEP